MAKKKDTQPMTDLLNGIMSSMTNEELEAAIEMLVGGADKFSDEFFETYYHYQCPDYSQIIQPIAPYLMPLWEIYDLEELSLTELYDMCSSIPKDELERALRNFVFNILVEFKKDPEGCSMHRTWYVFALMDHYRLERCLDVVLEILRQDLNFYNHHFGFECEELLSIIVYRLGKKKLSALMDFMKEPGLLPVSKYRVVEAVANIVIASPSRRVEVMAWFCKLLNYYFTVLDDPENDICPSMLLDHIAACMMDTRGVETLPILEKIYQTHHITSYGIEDISILKKKMPHTELHGLEMDSVEAFLNDYMESLCFDRIFDDDFDDDDYFDDEDDEEYFDDEYFDRPPLYLPSNSVMKLSVKIELEGSEPSIWRTMEVPSNICLERFAEIVENAMGWDGYHLHQFIKGNVCYLPPEDTEEGDASGFSNTLVNSCETTLGELLTRKGAKLKYEYDFGDSWMHTIVLESRQAYKKEEIPSVILLDGANACPPENCRGIRGYRNLLEELANPGSKDMDDYEEWLIEDLDPTFFDLEASRNAVAEAVEE